jgi:flagellar M-ring protein FliF
MGRGALEKLWFSFAGLGLRRLFALAIVGIGVMALLGVGAYYLSRPQQDILYSGLTRDDVGRIGGALKDAGIDFDVSADGATVTVNYGDTAKARMLLAEKGLPQSTSSGYELFNQVGSFGLTSFMQNVTKTRALEGELARTIQSMDGVKGARVHLVLPDRSSFRSDQQPASASVVIRTERPADTAPAQAIRHLVAAAVPGLKVDNVTVLNTEGDVLASGDDIESASAGKMATVEQTINREIEENVRRTLTPYLGLGNFQVSVTARLNLDRSTTSEVTYDPASRVERSVRTVKENALAQNSSSDAAAGVQQNLPDQKGTGEAGKNSNETNDRREETTNYELSSRTVETAHDGFKVERLSIAVLVNKARLDELAGKGADALPVEHQMMDIEQLVSAASGFTKDRGDQLKVASVEFVNEAPQEIPQPGLVEKITGQMGFFVNSLALVVIALIAVLFGLRPAVRAILAAQPVRLPAMTEPALEAGQSAPAIAVSGMAPPPPLGEDEDVNLIEDVTKKMNRSPQKRLEQIVEYDEAQAVAILRQWLHQDEAA